MVQGSAGCADGITRAITGHWSISNMVIRLQSGRIVKDTITRGPIINVSTYNYDAAGRFIAWTPKSFAICSIVTPGSRLRATRTTSSRNSVG